MPALVRVSGRGIDLRGESQPACRGPEGPGGTGRSAMHSSVSEGLRTYMTDGNPSTPHALHAGPTETLPYTHSSTGYEPSVGSVTRPPQFRHQARRNCNSRKDSNPPQCVSGVLARGPAQTLPPVAHVRSHRHCARGRHARAFRTFRRDYIHLARWARRRLARRDRMHVCMPQLMLGNQPGHTACALLMT